MENQSSQFKIPKEFYVSQRSDAEEEYRNFLVNPDLYEEAEIERVNNPKFLKQNVPTYFQLIIILLTAYYMANFALGLGLSLIYAILQEYNAIYVIISSLWCMIQGYKYAHIFLGLTEEEYEKVNSGKLYCTFFLGVNGISLLFESLFMSFGINWLTEIVRICIVGPVTYYFLEDSGVWVNIVIVVFGIIFPFITRLNVQRIEGLMEQKQKDE